MFLTMKFSVDQCIGHICSDPDLETYLQCFHQESSRHLHSIQQLLHRIHYIGLTCIGPFYHIPPLSRYPTNFERYRLCQTGHLLEQKNQTNLRAVFYDVSFAKDVVVTCNNNTLIIEPSE